MGFEGANQSCAIWARKPGSEEHDQICRYVKQDSVVRRVCSLVLPDWDATEYYSELEVPVVEIGYRFRRDHGFADMVISAGRRTTKKEMVEPRRFCHHRGELVPATYEDVSYKEWKRILVEVKSGKVIVGDVLRQLKTYATWLDHSAKVLVAPHLEPEQVDHLRSEGVFPLVLGDAYKSWKSTPTSPAAEI